MLFEHIMETIKGTINDIDYTKKACRNVRRLVNSEEFEYMDSEMILHNLYNYDSRMDFKYHLKRYLYEAAEIREPFSEVGDEVYCEIIRDSFQENRAPHSFGPTTKKWTATIRDWLTKTSVQRQTIFLLGFGLGMKAREVSDFLVKGIKEEDFNMTDKEEAIYYYCYLNRYPYQKAVELQEKYEILGKSSRDFGKEENFDLKKMLENGDAQTREEDFLEYLAWLKESNVSVNNQEKAYQHFQELLLETKKEILKIYQADERDGQRGPVTLEQINNGDVEKMICCGIPVTKNGNLEKMSHSCLRDVFQKYRLSRQRITGLTNKKLRVERFDLLTLNFFLYSQIKVEADEELDEAAYKEQEDKGVKERFKAFLESMNNILGDCGMVDIYPVNPYESHILMCLLKPDALATYADVWEQSFQMSEIE